MWFPSLFHLATIIWIYCFCSSVFVFVFVLCFSLVLQFLFSFFSRVFLLTILQKMSFNPVSFIASTSGMGGKLVCFDVVVVVVVVVVAKIFGKKQTNVQEISGFSWKKQRKCH